jgi:G:T-mismatch repair DNA endonuclease (very short patch repair protein)
MAFEFFGCLHHEHVCQPFRDVITMRDGILAERYERSMSRLEQITRAGYQVKVQWECEFDGEGIAKRKSELLTHPIVQQSILRTRDDLYGGRIEAMRLHYKARENEETIQYVDVMTLYP